MGDENLIEKKLSSENVFDGVLLHVKRDKIELPNGHEAVREWIAHPGASAIVPLLPDGRIILVRQYRYPVARVTLEIPAGKLDIPGEDPIECAKRELSEETGFSTKKIWKLTSIATTVGFTDEWIHIYAATELESGRQHTDEDEFINCVKMPLTEAVSMVERGEIYDAKSAIGILLLNKAING